jgi:hypothetical protein
MICVNLPVPEVVPPNAGVDQKPVPGCCCCCCWLFWPKPPLNPLPPKDIFTCFGSLFLLIPDCLTLHPFGQFIRGLIHQKPTVTTRERATKRKRGIGSGRKEFEIRAVKASLGMNPSRENDDKYRETGGGWMNGK